MAKALLLQLVSAFLLVAAASAHAPRTGTRVARGGGGSSCYSRFFAFGDSIIDTGNFIHYSTAPGSVARSPYGETFFHRPTGRWSDGRLPSDFIVERLGFPYWTPYLAGKTKEDFRYGANFAVASATALNQLLFKENHLDVNQITPYSLSVQVEWFKKVLHTLASTDHEREEIMASSLFLVGEIGYNDYNHPFFQKKTLDWVVPLVPRVIGSIGEYLEALIQLGAKTLYVPGIFPLGCVPRYLFLFRDSDAGDYDSATGCLRWLNALAELHNTLLKAKLAELRRAHQQRGVSIVYVDYYGVVLDLIAASPRARNGVGASAALDACCGGPGLHNANFTVHCSEAAAVLCPDPSRYVSWDGLHFTEAAYRVMAGGMLDGPFATPAIMSGLERVGSQYWPRYLAGKTEEDFRYGANFAVASATALDQQFFKKKHLDVGQITPYSLAVQISWFQNMCSPCLAPRTT
ncbi:Sinapine esterase, partial [Dichanthelium oligosanthes]